VQKGCKTRGSSVPFAICVGCRFTPVYSEQNFSSKYTETPPQQGFWAGLPIVQYADDTLVILPADAVQLWTLKGLLRSFADSMGLKVSYNKSFLVPINVENEKATHLATLQK
jgi:hypothetical protein